MHGEWDEEGPAMGWGWD